MNYAELIATIKIPEGIDVSDAQAGIWVNDRHKRLCVGANWTKRRQTLGTTVDGTSRYALDEDVTEIHELRVGTTPYTRAGTQSLWEVQGEASYVTGPGGVYSPMFDDTGGTFIELSPTPEDDGNDIEAIVTYTPADMTGTDTPLPPADFHNVILEGAMADALASLDENLAAADRYEARFEAGIEKLRRRQNRRFGGGPHHIKIERVHYSR